MAILLSAGLGASSRTASAQTPFFDDFQTVPRIVHVSPGSWRAVDGALQSSETQCCLGLFHREANWIVLGEPSWQNFQVDLDFRLPKDEGEFGFASHVSFENTSGEAVSKGFITVLSVRPTSEEFNASGHMTVCGTDLRGGIIGFPPYAPGWHHLTAVIHPDAVQVFIDGRLISDMGNAGCSTHPEVFGLGHAADGQVVEIDNLRVGPVEEPVSATPGTWGRIKANRR